MISCFKVGGSRKIEKNRVVFDANPYEYSDTTKSGYLHRSAKIFGRDDDRDKIKRLLFDTVGELEKKNPSVVPIVGIGGLGKTTLARFVYNDGEVARRFDVRAWFCVTENLDMTALMREVIKSATGDECDDYYISEDDLRRAVAGKKFLLVLDDVWDENVEELNRFEYLLRDAVEGSRIIVTTRSERVAMGLGGGGGGSGATSIHHLQGLSDEDCWKLFKRMAFSAVREETQGLERIGKEIVEKFQGVPLIAIAIGSLLQFESDRSVWSNIRDSEIWELPELANKTLSALKLSYNHLPLHLKRCFEYCSLFPKAYEIDRKKLVELWMAEDSILPSGEKSMSRDVGSECFNDLLLRSFFQEEADFGHTITYKMHDLFRDLAQSIVGDEHLTMEADKARNIPKGCRRLVLVCSGMISTISEASYKSKRLETLLLLMKDPRVNSTYQCAIKEVSREMFSSLRYLRLLDLSSTSITELPDSIGKMKHLTYLNLSETGIQMLPESIGWLKSLRILNLESCQSFQALPRSIKTLRNLAVLNLEWCSALQELPEGIWNMRSLTHLQIDGCQSLTRMPLGLGKLTNLQTLSMFFVDEERGCSIVELQHMNLRGELYIMNLGNLKNPVDVKKANLKEKHQLRQLGLYWNDEDKGFGEDGRDVLKALQPHPNLEELKIGRYGGTEFPDWMGTTTIELSLPNLVDITLGGFGRCEDLPPLGQLPSLKALKIIAMDAVKHLGSEFYGKTGTFPLLEEFKITDMPVLEEWSLAMDGREMFPRLTTLEIAECPQLRALPHLPSLEVLMLSESSGELLSTRSLAGLGLPSLKELKVSWCGAASSGWEGLRYLTTLEELTIGGCKEPSLPEGVRHLTSLRSLNITHCTNLTVLPGWLGNFASLESLGISFCPKLVSLPESVQCLPALQTLDIGGGPELWSQYLTGEDQHNIENVPNIKFEMWADLTTDL